MALRGKGALAIWNGIADGWDAEFVAWHVGEHMPERIGLPGFLSGRRYTAVDGHPAYFNFYEVAAPEVLRSATYLARLGDPSPWTRKVVAKFTDTSRTLCSIAASAGIGAGGFAEIVRFASIADPARAADFAARLAGDGGACAAHLFLADGGPRQQTAESELRRSPDLVWAAILVVETPTPQSAAALRAGSLADAELGTAGLGRPAGRGLYRLDYLLRREDLAGSRS